MFSDLLTRRLLLSTLVVLGFASCTDENSPTTGDRDTPDAGGVPLDGGGEISVADDAGGASLDAGEVPLDGGRDISVADDAGGAALDAGGVLLDAGGASLDLGLDMTADMTPLQPDATPPPYDETWTPHDLSGVDAYAISSSAKIFANQHPDYQTIPETVALATSNRTIRVSIDVYLVDSTIWTEPDQLLPYFALTNDYFTQTRIELDFDFRQGEAPAWEEDVDQLHLYFTAAMMNPRGATPDGFGNLPAGKAVLNDQLMDRPHVHTNPLFLPGKTIGHEIGHVLGLPHLTPRNFLMAQGTAARNQLDIGPEESVIMRVMALHRFGAEIVEE